tara:strand:- start:226671 stop:227294 length:624 start_codon:yes stop_codon:yes gene_type:complete
MSNWILYSIGFLAQILFSSRLILQWLSSEKQKKVVTPSLFWALSLIASFLLFIYGYLRDDFAIMLGQILTYLIYIRNLQIQGQWQKLHLFFRWLFLIIPFMLVVYYYNNNIIDAKNLFQNDKIPLWLLVLGIISQVVFTFRFIYQWWYSEKKGESLLPFGFWLLSIIGAILILVYAIIRKDPVLFIGHIVGVTIYIRNVMLLKKQHA